MEALLINFYARMRTIPTYVINLRRRIDRKIHILHEFSGRDEFTLQIIEPVQDDNPDLSLWRTIRHIVKDLTTPNDDFILLCEDDHQFTANYQKDKLFEYIDIANKLDSDLLSGGVSAVLSFVNVNSGVFWMGNFNGLQFTILFKKFFNTILGAKLQTGDSPDLKISKLTDKKFFIYPFFSVQKEFGYSDVTSANNEAGKVIWLFDQTSKNIQAVEEVSQFYKMMHKTQSFKFNLNDYENVVIRTFIISHSNELNNLVYIEKQFANKKEFAVEIITATEHPKQNVAEWLTIREIIEKAITNEDDIIVVCKEEHEFTSHYNRNNFLKNILEAHFYGAGLLVGSVTDYVLSTRATDDLFWVNRFYQPHFIIIYKSLYQEILNFSFNDLVTTGNAFSAITSNKLVVYPFISRSLSSDYLLNEFNPVSKADQPAARKLDTMSKVYNAYLRLSH